VVAVSSAMQLVQAAYTLAELLGGEDDALDWIRKAGGDASHALPGSLTLDNRALMVEVLEATGTTRNGEVDRLRLAEIATVLQLAPFMRSAEDARRPAPTSRLVCTIPPEAVLPAEMRYIQRSLAILVADSLRIPGERVLLAAPYWSGAGTRQLLEPIKYAAEHAVPITLAGARRVDAAHHTTMLTFARELRQAGARVEVLTFDPPRKTSLFHAKIVAGKRGYLGTGNLSIGGFEDNVEVGLPLDETDVERIWWLIDRLVEGELLVREELV
jgi:hypothetical protein